MLLLLTQQELSLEFTGSPLLFYLLVRNRSSLSSQSPLSSLIAQDK